MNFTPTKIASRDELMKVPPGLYELPDRKPGVDIYDALQDVLVDGELTELARVGEPDMLHRIPETLDVTVRPDGRIIVSQWTIVPGTERNRRARGIHGS